MTIQEKAQNYDFLLEEYNKLETAYNEALCTIEKQLRTINTLKPVVKEYYTIMNDCKTMLFKAIAEALPYNLGGVLDE